MEAKDDEINVAAQSNNITKTIKETQYYLGSSLNEVMKIFDIVPFYNKNQLLNISCGATTINIKKQIEKSVQRNQIRTKTKNQRKSGSKTINIKVLSTFNLLVNNSMN